MQSEFESKNSFFPPQTASRCFVVHVQTVTEGNPKVEVKVSIENNVLKLIVNARKDDDAWEAASRFIQSVEEFLNRFPSSFIVRSAVDPVDSTKVPLELLELAQVIIVKGKLFIMKKHFLLKHY